MREGEGNFESREKEIAELKVDIEGQINDLERLKLDYQNGQKIE